MKRAGSLPIAKLPELMRKPVGGDRRDNNKQNLVCSRLFDDVICLEPYIKQIKIVHQTTNKEQINAVFTDRSIAVAYTMGGWE
jgi:hypothetical protein